MTRTKRAIGLLVAIFGGALAVSNSLATVVAKVDASRAYSLAPYDSRIAARYAARQFANVTTEQDRRRLVQTAEHAIEGDATAVDALVALAFNSQLGGEGKRESALFDYINKLSRREFQAQGWAIEDAVNRGDIKRALFEYDVALRTSETARNLLFPVLSSALAEPRIRAELLEILKKKPNWTNNFVQQLVNQPDASLSAVVLIEEAEAGGVTLPLEDEQNARLVDNLFDSKNFDAAWKVYAKFRKSSSRTSSRNGQFESDVANATVFDWRGGEDPDIFVSIVPSKADGYAEYTLPTNGRTVALKQSQVLPEGRYIFEAMMDGPSEEQSSQAYWSVQCLDGRELLRTEDPRNAARSSFLVPANCPAQTLELMVLPTANFSNNTGRVLRASIQSAEQRNVE